MMVDFSQGNWINQPGHSSIAADHVEIVTAPQTDFWQRSYYGFRNNNAPALLLESKRNFTFTVKVSFNYKRQFDQCGVIIYMDEDNWFKASIEFEDEERSRLGSVVTNLGYSDWATTDIETPSSIWYRLSRRGPDFLIESAQNSGHPCFEQMRIFHLHAMGETTPDMGLSNPPLVADKAIRFGLYACSPTASSFVARFTDFKMTDTIWQEHSPA